MTLAAINNRTANFWTRASRVTAILFVWMCSIGVIAHHDDPVCGASMRHTASFAHADPVAPRGECAACEWTSSVQASTPFVICAPIPRYHTLAKRRLSVVRPHSPTLFSILLRGPPVASIA